MSLAELLYRLQSWFRKRFEKQRYLRTKARPDVAFIKLLTPEYQVIKNMATITEKLLVDFRKKSLFVWQKQPVEQIRQLFESQFPDVVKATFSAAAKALAHRFNFFDLEEQVFPEAINWNLDPLEKKTISLKFWSEIDYWNPGVIRDVKYVWELNRHQHLIALAQAYYLTGAEKYAREACDQLNAWMQANPPELGINWCSSLELAIRIISWTWLLAYIRTSSYCTGTFYFQVLKFIHAQARHIHRHLSQYSSANNHLIGEAVGLIYAGTYFTMLKNAKKWCDLGYRILNREIVRQVHPDGGTKEQAFHYQTFVMDFLVLAILADRDNMNISNSVREYYARMADFLLHLMDANGQIPHIGDGDDGHAIILDYHHPGNNFFYLNFAAVYFNNRNFKLANLCIDAKTVWLLGPQVIDQFHTLPDRTLAITSKNFATAGYAILRQSEAMAESIVTFDYGPMGLSPLAAHGHADTLAITLRYNGEPFLIDPGTYRYLGGGRWRDYFRGTAAHNTAGVDGMNQSEILAPFQWGKKATAKFLKYDENIDSVEVIARHDGFAKKNKCVIHQRKLLFKKPDTWIIADSFFGTGTHDIQIHFHLGPTLKNINTETSSIFCEFNKATLKMQQLDANFDQSIVFGQENPILGWMSPGYGVKLPIHVIKYEKKAVLPVNFRFKIQVLQKN